MGQYEYHRYRWQFWLRQDIFGFGNRRSTQSSMGGYLVDGKKELGRIRSSPDWQLQDSYYKPLTPEQSRLAFRNEYDFDSPEALDFDALIENLQELKAG